MLGLGWLIALGVWATYALVMIFLIKVLVRSSLKYLHHPPVNFMSSCKAAARYDMANLNTTQLTFGAIFLFPVRLVIMISSVLLTTMFVLIIKWTFCGRLLLIQ